VHRIGAVALNTFREAVRDRVLYGILFFAVCLLLFSFVLGELALYAQERVVEDVGIAGLQIFSVLMAVFLGVSLFYKEIEKKTLYTVLPKPVARWEVVVGKFAGLYGTLLLQIAVMGVVLAAVLVASGIAPGRHLFLSLLLAAMEVGIVAAIAIFFTSFSTPFVSGLFTLGVFVVGRLVDSLWELSRGSPALRAVARAVGVVAPNLYLYVPTRRTLLDTDGFVAWAYVAKSLGYGALYTVIALALAAFLFERRDLV